MNALIVLSALPPGGYEGAATIADRIGAPRNYLSKQLKALVREGLVNSKKGMGGGFCLAKPGCEIALFDVVEKIDHVSRWQDCFLGGVCDCNSQCAVHASWAHVRKMYLDFLCNTKIADLVTGDLRQLPLDPQ